MSVILNLIRKIAFSTLYILNDTSVWLVISFLFVGLFRNILTPERFQKMLGNRKFSSIIKSTLSGMLLPMCSCGVIPLGISMYYSGAYLGPTLAFMASSPILNPAALILTFGLLGPEIGIIYIITGLITPVIIGLIGNKFGGSEICLSGSDEAPTSLELQGEDSNIINKIYSGLHWAFMELGLSVSKYVVPGILLAGIILSIVPQQFIQNYLGRPGMVSLGGIAFLSGVMYVCAVGHIPFIAALIAAGAAPGTAITFLMTGAATNIPELISIYKLIGKRATIMYSVIVTLISLISGYIANLILLPGFKPFMDVERNRNYVRLANSFTIAAPEWIKYVSSVVIFVLFILAVWPVVRKKLIKGEDEL